MRVLRILVFGLQKNNTLPDYFILNGINIYDNLGHFNFKNLRSVSILIFMVQ